MTTKTSSNPWTMDVRVRERNLKSGSLTEKDLEKNLAALPDLDGQYDSFTTPQPALEQPRIVAPPAPIASESDDDLDDEDDEDEDDDDTDDTDDESSDDVGGDAAGSVDAPVSTPDEGGAAAGDEAPAGDAGGASDETPSEGGGEA